MNLLSREELKDKHWLKLVGQSRPYKKTLLVNIDLTSEPKITSFEVIHGQAYTQVEFPTLDEACDFYDKL